MDYNFTNFAGWAAGAAILGTVLGVIVRGWTSIKAYFTYLYSFFVTTVMLNDEITSNSVLAYLLANYKQSGMASRCFGGRYENISALGKHGHIPFEDFTNRSIVFWIGWKPITYLIPPEQATKQESVIYWGNKPKPARKAVIKYFRGTVDIQKIIAESASKKNESMWNDTRRRFFIKKIPDPNMDSQSKFYVDTSVSWYNEGIYKLLSHNPDDLGLVQAKGKALDNLILPAKIKKLVDEIDIWCHNRDWYAEKSIPWKRGWLLYGLPGSGKTALIRAIAEDFDLPLYVFSLGEMMNSELQKSWSNMQANTPCIALFEDFDNVFHGRENVFGKASIGDLVSNQPTNSTNNAQPVNVNRGQLSFDCLLNCIDGVDKCGGIFTVITTNDVTKLDAALGQPRKSENGQVEFISTRPGRIDKAIEFSYMAKYEKTLLAKKIFTGDPKGLKQILNYIEDNPDSKETPAQFQERCSQLAISIFWKEKELEKQEKVVHRNGFIKHLVH